MKRSERMAPVQRVLGNAERDRARDLGTAQRAVAEAESKLQDLRQYHKDYVQSFQQRAKAGHRVMALRDFQIFLARLEEAIRQQEQIAAGAKENLAGSTQRWHSAARQVKAVDVVLDKWQSDERRVVNRREQKETDERAQTKAMRTGKEQET